MSTKLPGSSTRRHECDNTSARPHVLVGVASPVLVDSTVHPQLYLSGVTISDEAWTAKM